MERREPLATGYTVSGGAHALVFVGLIWGFWSPPKLEPPIETIPVEMITTSDLNQIMNGEKNAKQMPVSQRRVDKVAELEDHKDAPPTPDAAKDTPPEPTPDKLVVDPGLADPKPAEPKPTAPNPVEAKPVEVKPPEAKPPEPVATVPPPPAPAEASASPAPPPPPAPPEPPVEKAETPPPTPPAAAPPTPPERPVEKAEAPPPPDDKPVPPDAEPVLPPPRPKIEPPKEPIKHAEAKPKKEAKKPVPKPPVRVKLAKVEPTPVPPPPARPQPKPDKLFDKVASMLDRMKPDKPLDKVASLLDRMTPDKPLDKVASLLDRFKPDPAKPAPRPEPVKPTPRPEARAEPRPEPAKVEPQKPVERPRSGNEVKEAKPRDDFNPDKIAAMLSHEAPQRKASTGHALAQVASLGSPTAHAEKMSPSVAAQLDGWLIDHYRGCWSYFGLGATQDYVPTIRIHMAQDGSLIGAPSIVNPPRDPNLKSLADSALRAVNKCNPLPIPERFRPYYDQGYRQRIVRFDPKEMS